MCDGELTTFCQAALSYMQYVWHCIRMCWLPGAAALQTEYAIPTKSGLEVPDSSYLRVGGY